MSFYREPCGEIYCGDARKVLSEMPGEFVQCVTTSPPFWGLRKYSGEQETIWGDNHCQHEWIETNCPTKVGKQGMTETDKWPSVVVDSRPKPSNTCSLCGAWKGALGLEPTPEMYVSHIVEIFREGRRVLRKDGVAFLNIGDSYATHASKRSGQFGADIKAGFDDVFTQRKTPARDYGLKEKDLCLIPFRLAIALQSDGWWLRSVIIWSKNNPMPESVTDRPTESHEYILMLTKSARYYWDAEAVREPSECLNQDSVSYRVSGKSDSRKKRINGIKPAFGYNGFWQPNSGGRNIRTVWEFPTQPFPTFKVDGKKIDHFAVFPEKLPELCILAATPEVGSCSKCGAPWVRAIEVSRPENYDPSCVDEKIRDGWGGKQFSSNRPLRKIFEDSLNTTRQTLGWQPSCSCNAGKAPSVVLDLFCGAGTTPKVAKELGRRFVGIDISEEYCELSKKRVEAVSLPMF